MCDKLARKAAVMKVNLGCGWAFTNDRGPEWIDVDRVALASHVMIYDLDQFPWPWETDSVEEVIANHVIEHCHDRTTFIEELFRVCCHGALVHMGAPNFRTHPEAWEDPTHRQPMHPGTMDYFKPGHPYGFYSPAKFVSLEINHDRLLLNWLLAAYKRDDGELLARHVNWRDSEEKWR